MDHQFGLPNSGAYRFLITENNSLIASMDVDFTNQVLLQVQNYSNVWFKLPFGNNPNPTFEDFCYYLKTRIVSESYGGLDALYEKFAPEVRDRYHLLLKMHGRVATDHLEITEEKLW